MPIRALGTLSALVLALGLQGCHSPSTPKPKPKKAAEQVEDADAENASPDGGAPDGADSGVSDPAKEDPLGQRFVDPPWYSTEIIPHTKIVQNGRSEARPDGTFSSAMVLHLEEGMSAQACLDHLKGKVEGISFGESKKGDDGRLTANGEADRYRVTLVCGEVKGVATAYVGYEWKPEG